MSISKTNIMNFADKFTVQNLSITGKTYFFDWINENHPATTKLYVEFISSPNKFTILESDKIYTNSTEFFLKVYNIYDTVSNISPLNIIPIRVGSPFEDFNPPEATVNTVTAPSSVGVALNTTPIIGETGFLSDSGGSTNETDFIRILPPDTNFIIELDNRDTSSVYSQLQLRWAEVDHLPNVKGFY